jgi:hypothetical protein
VSEHDRPWWACGVCEFCGDWLEDVPPYGPGCGSCHDGALLAEDAMANTRSRAARPYSPPRMGGKSDAGRWERQP